MRRLWCATVVVAVLAGTLGAATAYAQQDFVESDPGVIRAREQVAAAQLAAHQAAQELAATTQQRDAVQASIDEHVARVEELGRQRATLAEYRDALRAVMRERAVALYRNGGDGTGIAAIQGSGSVLEAARRQTLGEAAAESNDRTARKFDEVRTQLAALQATLRDEEAQLRVQREELDRLVAQQAERQATLDQRVAAANAVLAQARAVGALRASGDPVMGPSTLTAEQLAGWVRSQGFRPRINADLTELAQIFIEEGNDEGVRGDFAFAQSVIETGGFESAPANNFAGIGWCDTCTTGNRFPNPREGVRAQIQLLVNYADAGATAARLKHPVSPYLYGADPVAAARKFDAFYAKGWAPTWRDMGNGNWATDPGYSQKVIGVYRKMVAYSQGG